MRLRNLIEDGDPEQIATDLKFTEGPLWHPDGYLLFSDIPADRIGRWAPDGAVTVYREPSGFSNGLTFDPEGRLIACEHGNRRVTRTEADGTVVPLADSYNGKPLNSPNDVVARSDGLVYFTDPPYGLARPFGPADLEQEQPQNGVFLLRPDGALELLADDFVRPNGLAFSPDESVLYVDDSRRRHVRAFDVRADGTLANSRVVADLDHPQPGSPDGMKVDSEGHLYVAGATGVWVFEPDGELLGVLVAPERPANCAWGDADRRTLYITARKSLYRVRVKVPGAPGVWQR